MYNTDIIHLYTSHNSQWREFRGVWTNIFCLPEDAIYRVGPAYQKTFLLNIFPTESQKQKLPTIINTYHIHCIRTYLSIILLCSCAALCVTVYASWCLSWRSWDWQWRKRDWTCWMWCRLSPGEPSRTGPVDSVCWWGQSLKLGGLWDHGL